MFRVPGEDADAWIVSQTNDQPWSGMLGGFDIALPHGGEAVLIVGRDGGLRAAGCEGSIRKNGNLLADGSTRFFAVAEDAGTTLAEAKRLLVMPLGAGEIRIARSKATHADAEAGEFQNGAWRGFGPLPVRKSNNAWVISVPDAHARDLVQVEQVTFWQSLFR